MDSDRIQKLPKWAQQYIAELEQRAFKAECRQEAIQVMHNGAPTIKPNLHYEDDRSVSVSVDTGWLARRNANDPIIGKAPVTPSRSVYTSPALALRSLLPVTVQAYRDEIAAILNLIKEYEQE